MPFRSMDVSDLPQLLRFERAYLRAVEPHALDRWTGAIDRNLQLWIECLPTSTVLTGEDDAVQGIALWQSSPPVATLVAIHVVPELQRHGLGARLLAEFLRVAEAGGLERAALGVHEDNPGAERMYVRHGFRQVGDDGPYRLYERRLQGGGSGHGAVGGTAG